MGGVVNDDGPVVAGGRGRELEEGAVAGLALDGGVDSLVGLHVVVAAGPSRRTPLSEDARRPRPRDRVDGRRCAMPGRGGRVLAE